MVASSPANPECQTSLAHGQSCSKACVSKLIKTSVLMWKKIEGEMRDPLIIIDFFIFFLQISNHQTWEFLSSGSPVSGVNALELSHRAHTAHCIT